MNKNAEQDVAFIRALAELLRESELTEIEVTREYGADDELKVRLSRAAAAVAPVALQPLPAQPAPTAHQAPASPAPAAATSPEPSAEPAGPDLSKAVTSPMVGTVYLSSEPGSEPFVTVGDTVAEGETLLIIEAMKTMNQIPSPRGGTVRQILVANAEPVEFGHPLMVID
ncbi:MAG TPA: acetyl-CoA carboxylase biotin carboxyl carrier protein [Thermohalobaculum sp.]|nr:acetyl-CoA carboxylase biotin carboxyl carrier protein [Thermohalobaculum sp.]